MPVKRSLLCAAIAAFIVAFTWNPLSVSQTTTATLLGTITDETGGVLPGAEVTVTNVATGIKRTVVTNEGGRFVVPQLPPGPYQLSVTMPGFESLLRSGITLTVGQEAALNLKMKVGAVSEQVTITGEAPLINITGSEVSGVVEEKRILDLPLNGRDFTQLALVQPGIISARNTDSIVQKGFGARISVAGSRPDQTGWLLDGTNIKSMSNFGTPGSAAGFILGVDGIREFRVLTSNYSAEFGTSQGGVINMVSKSGTNDWHGSAFEFHRNDNLDARNFFDRAKPEFKRNQFGGSLGGRIKKDKTFVFGNYEGLRERLGLSNVAVVPDENAHRGLIPDGQGGLQQVQVSPAIRPYLDLWPLPNGPAVGRNSGLATLTSPANDATREDFFMARGDHRINDNQSLFARFSFDQGNKSRPETIPVVNDQIRTRTRYATVQYDLVITPQFLSTSRVAYNRTNLGSGIALNINYPANLFFINKTFPPNFIFPGADRFGPDDRTIFGNVQNLYQFTQNFIYTTGNHSFKIGFDFQRVGLNTDGGPANNFQFEWNTLRDMLTDGPLRNFRTRVPDNTTQRTFKQAIYAPYFQDDWRVRPNLTINLGVRYEPFTVPVEKFGRISVVRDWVTATRFDNNIKFWRNPSNKDISPRVGFAWQPTGDGKTAVRGGFGIFFPVLLGNTFRTPATKNPPFAAAIEKPVGNGRLSTALNDVLTIGPTLLNPVFTPDSFLEIIQWNLNTTYDMKFNLTVERELPGNISVALGYLGSRGNHLWRESDANDAPSTFVNGREFVARGTPRVNPNAGTGTTRNSDAKSFYNALQVEVKRRFSHRFQFQSSYTFSRLVDDASTGTALTDFNEGEPPSEFSTKIDRGLSALHQKHNFVVNGIWEPPFPVTSGVASKFFEGWRLSGIFSASSGTPFSANIEGRTAPNLSRTANRQRPDLVADRSSDNIITGDPNRFFDSSAFFLPPPGFFGNAGRNILIGPKFVNLDFNVTKSTPLGITEATRLEFRADFFNLLNRSNFAIPAFTRVLNATTGQTVASAGKITKTVSTSRQIQFGVKLVF